MMSMKKHLISVLLVFINLAFCLKVPTKDVKPDVFILTDMSNEPDDAESFVRTLLYSNEIDIKGIVATTSFWLRNKTYESDVLSIIDAYEKVEANLRLHSDTYPTSEYLRSIVSSGHPVYGQKYLEIGKLSQGAKDLITAVDNVERGDSIWILLWGGANVLSEALNEVIKTRDQDDIDIFAEKIKVYAISDQDDSGAWIRHQFPKLFYIVDIHAFNRYRLATWSGISDLKIDQGGPNTEVVSHEWLEENIRSVSPLGNSYPDYMFIMEGDTPSLLYVLPNGLNNPDFPRHGGWGGRFDLTSWSKDFNQFSGIVETVEGVDGKNHTSNQATIWRFREAFQNDFAARMQWTVQSFENANHHPIISLNGTISIKPMVINVRLNETVYLDAHETYDLDSDDELTFKWWHYVDIPALSHISQGLPLKITSLNDLNTKVAVQLPEKENFYEFLCFIGDDCYDQHLILEVTDNGSPNLKAYRRIILHIVNDEVEQSTYISAHDEL